MDIIIDCLSKIFFSLTCKLYTVYNPPHPGVAKRTYELQLMYQHYRKPLGSNTSMISVSRLSFGNKLKGNELNYRNYVL
jgi:hypothetical protein